MLYPEFIKKGDIIGVTACSNGNTEQTDFNRMDHAIQEFADRGFLITETKDTRTSSFGRSTDAAQRVSELNSLLCRENVKAILMCSGGDYLPEILPYLDFSLFTKNPKWIQGYSDPTGLLYTITVNSDLATVYGNNFGDYGMEHWDSSLECWLSVLMGKEQLQTSYKQYMDGYLKRETGLEGYVLDKTVNWKNIFDGSNRCTDENGTVQMTGRLLGGCLDVLLTIAGTKYDKTCSFCEKYQKDGILWYLESFDLTSEALFLGLWKLKESGWFDTAKGFFFGRPLFFRSGYGISYEDAIFDALGALSVPIVLDADFGHKPPRMTIVNGAVGTVYSEGGKGNLRMQYR